LGAPPVAGGRSGNTGGSVNTGGVASNGGTPDAAGGTTEPPSSNGGASTTPEGCDCGDPSCQESVCVPAVPSGWSGPILLFEGALFWAPECTGYLDTVAFEGGTLPVQEKLSCIGCSCGEISGAGCSLALKTYSDASCTKQVTNGQVTPECTAAPQATYFKADGVEQSGSCQVSGGTLNSRSEPIWEWDARACAPSKPATAGCDGGAICMPKPTGRYMDTHCVYREGNQSCPAGYPTKHTYLTRLVDDRECPTCSCEVPPSCGDTLAFYNNETCTTNGPEFGEIHYLDEAPGTCREISSRFSPVALKLLDAFPPSRCESVTVASPGAIHGEDPVSVCCR
ncbi:MAG: hypothetical protein M3020_16960, partial [Myxococcota bacterium]|nr:hypothetical protein [Myxococcota bacterium]